jgi:hypothetical protein
MSGASPVRRWIHHTSWLRVNGLIYWSWNQRLAEQHEHGRDRDRVRRHRRQAGRRQRVAPLVGPLQHAGPDGVRDDERGQRDQPQPALSRGVACVHRDDHAGRHRRDGGDAFPRALVGEAASTKRVTSDVLSVAAISRKASPCSRRDQHCGGTGRGRLRRRAGTPSPHLPRGPRLHGLACGPGSHPGGQSIRGVASCDVPAEGGDVAGASGGAGACAPSLRGQRVDR